MKIKFLSVLTLGSLFALASCASSDTDLQKAASDKLSADSISGVAVAVKDGTATLTGEVRDVATRTKAEADVKNIEGIKTVNNHLSIMPIVAAPTPSDNDKRMEDAITENLKKASISGVTVSVNHGEATLSGQIPKADLAKAMAAATAVTPKITNQLVTK